MTQRHRKTLILGYGNSLRADDGAGVAVIDRLQAVDVRGVELQRCQQLTPELAETISHFENVFFIDASIELPTGEVRWQEIAPVQGSFSSLGHHLTPGTLLALCKSLYGAVPAGTVVAIGVGDLGASERLSPPVQRAVEAVVGELSRRLGHSQPGRGRRA